MWGKKVTVLYANVGSVGDGDTFYRAIEKVEAGITTQKKFQLFSKLRRNIFSGMVSHSEGSSGQVH